MKSERIVVIWIVLVVFVAIKVALHLRSFGYPTVGETITIVGNVDRVFQSSGTQTAILLDGIWIDLTVKSPIRAGDNISLTTTFGCTESPQVLPYSCNTYAWRASPTSIKVLGENIAPLFFIKSFRSRIQAVFHEVMGGPKGELFSSIVIGGNDLPRSFKEQLARVGLSHVVAASGMNVTLLAAGLSGVLSVFSFSPKHKVIVMIGLITLYSGITGFDPPIVRAALMASSVYVAPLFGRKTSSWPALFLTALLMLWVKPSLLTNYGFLLSFGSMVGQIGLITLSIRLSGIKGAVIGTVLQTSAAIEATLPIVLVGFSQFSLISMATNVLVVWVIEPLMFLGIAVSLLGLVSADLARVLALPARPLLDYFMWVVRTFDRPEFVLNLSMHWVSAVGYYLALLAFYVWIRAQRALR